MLQCVAVCRSVLQCVVCVNKYDSDELCMYEYGDIGLLEYDDICLYEYDISFIEIVKKRNCSNCRSLLQNIVFFKGLFCKKDLQF